MGAKSSREKWKNSSSRRYAHVCGASLRCMGTLVFTGQCVGLGYPPCSTEYRVMREGKLTIVYATFVTRQYTGRRNGSRCGQTGAATPDVSTSVTGLLFSWGFVAGFGQRKRYFGQSIPMASGTRAALDRGLVHGKVISVKSPEQNGINNLTKILIAFVQNKML